MTYSVSEAADACGTSVRTLHYYDELGLLHPTAIADNGYRSYDDAALERLRQILFFRQLEFPLREIPALLDCKNPVRRQTLESQKTRLLEKQQQLEQLLRLLDETMKEDNMTKEKLEHLRREQAAYAAEAEQKYGDTAAWKESQTHSHTDKEELEAADDAEEIFAAFAAARDKCPEAPEVQALVVRWQQHITRWHYTCTKQILSCLGEMYTADPRFTENIDRHGDGTAELMRDAIRIYCQ